MSRGLRYETGRDMPPGMLEKVAVKLAADLAADSGRKKADAYDDFLHSKVQVASIDGYEEERGYMNIVYNMDCMEGMKRYPDGYFDLAVVDPMYGDVPYGGYMSGSGGGKAGQTQYHNAIWDQAKTPPEYFAELFRVSKNQIIWGGNYFAKEIGRDSSGWIVWDKCRPEGATYADCELAYSSFQKATRIFQYKWNGFIQQNMKHREVRIHPTQKPVDLYRWIFRNYAKSGDKILDTHLGSGTSRRAAYDFDLHFVGFEIDKTYYDLQEQAFQEYTSQIRLEI